ncbi:hypothetical protein [Sphingobium cupriresistens]|uniref:hypothetical protein n=1 Tax=Sphingobium cupriresistens TaxID=1132417 RepID=UPI003BADDB95
MKKKPGLFGTLFSFDTFRIFSDALFASGAALRYAKRQEVLHQQISVLLNENMGEVSPAKHEENIEKIRTLLAELEQLK